MTTRPILLGDSSKNFSRILFFARTRFFFLLPLSSIQVFVITMIIIIVVVVKPQGCVTWCNYTGLENPGTLDAHNQKALSPSCSLAVRELVHYSCTIFVFLVIYLSVTETRDETKDDKIYFYLRYIATLTIIISRLLMSRSLRCKCILIYIFKHYIFYILTAVSFYLITVALHCAIGYKVIPLVITDVTSRFSNL